MADEIEIDFIAIAMAQSPVPALPFLDSEVAV
jgi:hypothetical protein